MITSFFRTVAGFIGTLIGGLYLVGLYVFTIWLAVGSLTAIQVRDSLEERGQSFTFGDVERAQQNFTWARERVLRELADANQVQAKQRAIDTKLLVIWQTIDPSGWFFDTVSFPSSQEFRQFDHACRDHSGVIVSANGGCEHLADYYALADELRELNENGAAAAYMAKEDEARQKIETLLQKEPLSVFFPIYDFFKLAPLYAHFLVEPNEILILQLTIAMGMLGSVVTMTWSFIRQDSGLTFRRFIILPLVGSMSAFIILVLVKAGQITITAGEATDTLSPFFLSFVGIISGLLAERAYTRIADVGSNLFTVEDEETARWAVRLGDAMRASGVKVAELAAHLQVTEEEVDNIVREKTTATAQQQRLIAACVRRMPREIFTDVPPGPVAPPAPEASLGGNPAAAEAPPPGAQAPVNKPA